MAVDVRWGVWDDPALMVDISATSMSVRWCGRPATSGAGCILRPSQLRQRGVSGHSRGVDARYTLM